MAERILKDPYDEELQGANGRWSQVQTKAYKLYSEASRKVEADELQPFYTGFIPDLSDYKRLEFGRKQAIATASYGWITAKSELGVELYFTQALIIGVSALGTHHNLLALLPSQYGKSFVAACVALLQASKGEPVSVGANDSDTTKKIMNEVWKILPKAPEAFKKKLTTPVDKFEKAQTSMSKNRVGFIGGGYVEGMTLGGRYADSINGNKAVGQSGNWIIDESANIPDDNYSETGRNEVAYREDGRPYFKMEMSNPHQIGHFYRDMTQPDLPEGTLIIWADIRVSIEEGKQVYKNLDPKKPSFTDSKFFNNEKTCRSYLCCDFGATNGGSFFTTGMIVNNKTVDLETTPLILGLDSAHKGADAIEGALLAFPTQEEPYLHSLQLLNFKPNAWVDFETPQLIVQTIIAMCKKINIVGIVMDVGQGMWLYNALGEAIIEEDLAVALKAIAFNGAPTPERIRPGVDIESGDANSAEMAVNKRAELHLDLRELMETQSIQFTESVSDRLDPEMQAVGTELQGFKGKVQIEDKNRFVKKKLGHSPDALDAVMLSVHGYILFSLGLIGVPRSLGIYA